jgi:hypothetical protein
MVSKILAVSIPLVQKDGITVSIFCSHERLDQTRPKAGSIRYWVLQRREEACKSATYHRTKFESRQSDFFCPSKKGSERRSIHGRRHV